MKWTNCWPWNYSPSRLVRQFPACPPASSGNVLTKSNKIMAAVTSFYSHLRYKLDAVSSPWRNWWFSSAVFDCQIQTTWQTCKPFEGNWKKHPFFSQPRNAQGESVLKYALLICFFLRGKGFFLIPFYVILGNGINAFGNFSSKSLSSLFLSIGIIFVLIRNKPEAVSRHLSIHCIF